MSYFTTLLSSQARTLRLPSQSKDDIERYVLQHQKGNVSPEQAPFRRQLDFWAFAIASAIADGTPPLEDPPASWGRKFADTRSVQMPDGLCEMLAVIALTTLGPDHEGTDDPAQIIELGNRFAGAGCPKLLNQLSDPNLRATAPGDCFILAGRMSSAWSQAFLSMTPTARASAVGPRLGLQYRAGLR